MITVCHHRKSVDLSITSSAHSCSTNHLGFMSKRPARFSSSTSHNMAPIVIGSHFLASVFGLTGQSKRNLITKVVLLAGGPREGALELRILAAEGGGHRSLPGLRQRLDADPACCRGRRLSRLRRAAWTR